MEFSITFRGKPITWDELVDKGVVDNEPRTPFSSMDHSKLVQLGDLVHADGQYEFTSTGLLRDMPKFDDATVI